MLIRISGFLLRGQLPFLTAFLLSLPIVLSGQDPEPLNVEVEILLGPGMDAIGGDPLVEWD